nr:MAG TPA: hypothetical protein [Caudoviricetes sp.]
MLFSFYKEESQGQIRLKIQSKTCFPDGQKKLKRLSEKGTILWMKARQ